MLSSTAAIDHECESKCVNVSSYLKIISEKRKLRKRLQRNSQRKIIFFFFAKFFWRILSSTRSSIRYMSTSAISLLFFVKQQPDFQLSFLNKIWQALSDSSVTVKITAFVRKCVIISYGTLQTLHTNFNLET